MTKGLCPTCKRSLSSATSESEPNVQPEKANNDRKKQTTILKYFVHVKKQVKKQQTPFRMISLRGNKHAFEKYTCILNSDNKISSITKGPSRSPQKKDKRKPSTNETSVKSCSVKMFRLPPALTKLLLAKMNAYKNDELALGIVSGKEPFHGFSSSCKDSSLTRYNRLRKIIDAACKRKQVIITSPESVESVR